MEHADVHSEPFLSTPQAARHLGVSTETLRRWAKRQKVRHYLTPSGRMRFIVSDLDAAVREVEPEEGAA